MSPKRPASKKTAARKPAAKKTRAPKAPSPMQKIEHAVGPNTGGLADQTRAAHVAPESPPKVGRSTPPPMNTPPTSTPPASAVDEGQR